MNINDNAVLKFLCEIEKIDETIKASDLKIEGYDQKEILALSKLASQFHWIKFSDISSIDGDDFLISGLDAQGYLALASRRERSKKRIPQWVWAGLGATILYVGQKIIDLIFPAAC